MVIATDEKQSTRRKGSATPAPESPETTLVAPPKLRRRPILVAAGVAVVCLGALLGMLAYTSASSAQEVLAVRDTVHRGDVIQRSDLMTVRVGVDPGLKPMSGNDLGEVVGKRAAYDMAAGGLVTSSSVTSGLVPHAGQSVVGIGVNSGQLPGVALEPGDRVRVIATPGDQGDGKPVKGTPTETVATVVDVRSGGSNGQHVVDVSVPDSEAAGLAAQASTGKVAVVLDSRER